MTELEQLRLRMYRDKYVPMGLMPKTSAEALDMSIEADNTRRDISPFDPTCVRFINESRILLEIAELLEKEENARGKTR